MPSHKHPKSEGALFLNDKKQENHPDFRGHVVVTSAQIKELIEMAKRFQKNPDNEKLAPKLQIAAWDRVAKDSGREYKFLSTEAYNPAKDEERKAPAPKQDQFDDLDDDDY
jgi:uncharacterized protein (DUF736 family)